MNHVIFITLNESVDLKEQIRKAVTDFIKRNNWKEIPIWDNIIIEINLNVNDILINVELFTKLCNSIYSLKTWLNEKYDKKISLIFINQEVKT